jgi:hypothetical protein
MKVEFVHPLDFTVPRLKCKLARDVKMGSSSLVFGHCNF